MDESSASSSSVWKHLEKNKGVGTVTCKLRQKLLKWNGSTTSSLKGPLRLQVKLCCQHGAHIRVANTFFFLTKLDNDMILFMLALFENIRLFVLRVENYSIRTK